MNTADRILAALTALFLVGAAVRVARPAEATRPIWPVIPEVGSVAAPPAPERVDGAVRAALAGNAFSETRTAPAARFRPGAEEEGFAAEAMEAEPMPEPPPPGPPPPPRYRVAGTMLGAGGSFALIDADPGRPGAEVYRQGDAVGGYRLERIAYDHVVLVGGAGELRMDVARPGETPLAVQSPAAAGVPVPQQEMPVRERARSSANTPAGAIPPGW